MNQRIAAKTMQNESGFESFNAAIINARLINQLRRLTGQAIAHTPSVTYSGVFTYEINGLFILDRILSKSIIASISMSEGVARAFAGLLFDGKPLEKEYHRDAVGTLCRLLLEESVSDTHFLGIVKDAHQYTCNIIRKVHPITTPIGNVCFEVFGVDRYVGCLDDIPLNRECRCN